MIHVVGGDAVGQLHVYPPGPDLSRP
jgi:hypothetical protein